MPKACPYRGSIDASVSESTVSTLGLVDAGYRFPSCLHILLDHHLAYPLSVRNGEGFRAGVQHDDTDLTAIVGIDRAGRIEDRDTVAQCETGTRTYLTFVSGGELHEESGRDKCPLTGRKGYTPVREKSTNIHSGALRSAVSRERMMTSVDYLDFKSFF